MKPSPDAIQIKNLSKTFKTFKKGRVIALDDLSLSVGQGEVFGFLGPNGAGKSTTIKILMGLTRCSSGNASIFGVDCSDHRARTRVGFLPEHPAFYDYLSGREYLAFVGNAFGMDGKGLEAAIDAVLDRFDLVDAAKRRIRTYSKGMVQRLGLAQTTVHDPDLYVLDEPMSGLDPVGRALVKEVILDLKQKGKTVFFSTHITTDVEMVCDRMAILNRGLLKSLDRVEDVLLQGISGYRIVARDQSGVIHRNECSKDNLKSMIAEATEKGMEVTLVEPARKNLEQYFLEKIQE